MGEERGSGAEKGVQRPDHSRPVGVERTWEVFKQKRDKMSHTLEKNLLVVAVSQPEGSRAIE